MNEELKIIIKATVDEAVRNISKVKEEIEKTQKESKETAKKTDETFKAISKGALVAVAGITALTAAMVKLGKDAQEASKGFEKLNTTFLNAGSTTEQATQTYKDLFSFLGDHDKAIEAAQSLGLITQEEEKLAEWSNILQGAFAVMGDKLPTEGLAEAANETIKVGQVTGVMADALNWLGVSEEGFNAALAQTTSLEEREALVRNTLNGLYGNAAQLYQANNQATIDYNNSQANLNIALAEAAAYTKPLLTALNNLASTMLGSFGGAIRTIIVYLVAFIQIITRIISAIGNFFGLSISGSKSVTNSVGNYSDTMSNYLSNLKKGFDTTNAGVDKTINKVNQLKRQTMGFDELNVVSSQTTAGVGGLGGSGITTPEVTIPEISIPELPDMSNLELGLDLDSFDTDVAEAMKKIEGLLVLVGIVATAFGAWKLTEFIQGIKTSGSTINTKLIPKLKVVSGYILTIAGTMLLIKGYTDSWVNGVSWNNLATMIGGVAIAVTGLYLAFGKVVAVYASVAAGIAILITSLKDIITNGASVENVLGLIAGALLVVIPIIYAFNTALLANPIGLVIAAITALIAGIALLIDALWNEEPAIKSVTEAQEELNAAKEAAVEAENAYINAIDGAEGALRRLEEAEAAANMTGAELYALVEAGTLDYKDMDEAQRELYKAYLNNEQKQKDLQAATEELSAAKKAETMASYENQLAIAKESGNYDSFKKSIIDAYNKGELSAAEARDMIAKSMSEMSDSSRETFMEDIPDNIKDGLDPTQYESSARSLGRFFEGVGKFICNIFIGIINAVIAVINAIIYPFKAAFVAIASLFGVEIAGGYGFVTIPYIPLLAKGGIVDSATLAVVGEQGKEAVLPLENNTEWMDVLAERINGNNRPSKIVLQVDGRELGYATIDNINSITKQTGNLQLVLV